MKLTIVSIVIGVLIVAGAAFLSQNNPAPAAAVTEKTGSNVSIVDGVQIIDISAKGGYQPRQSTAKAGMPTILRFDTQGTFDCSSSVRIPSMNISKALPQTGTTDIAIGSQEASKLEGTCGMGMYPFEVDFQS